MSGFKEFFTSKRLSAKDLPFILGHQLTFSLISSLSDEDYAKFINTQKNTNRCGPETLSFIFANSDLFSAIAGMTEEGYSIFLQIIKNNSKGEIDEIAKSLVTSSHPVQQKEGGYKEHKPRQGQHQGGYKGRKTQGQQRGGYKGRNFDPNYHKNKGRHQGQRRKDYQQFDNVGYGYQNPSPAPSSVASSRRQSPSSRLSSPFKPVARPGTAPPGTMNGLIQVYGSGM
jgi:hypothetical protein